MLFYLLKFLLFLSRPWSLTLVSLIFVWWLLKKNKLGLAKKVLLATLLFMLSLSCPGVSNLMISRLENSYPALNLSQTPNADVIVVLGGTVSPLLPPRVASEEIHGARLAKAIELFQNQKAQSILVCGGVGYPTVNGARRTEANDMKDYLMRFGVPADQIIEENRSRNTKENLLFARQILKSNGSSKILLVTSGYHIKRAMAQLKNTGLEITPVPTDIRQTSYSLFDAITPSSDAFSLSTLAIKEYLALFYLSLTHFTLSR